MDRATLNIDEKLVLAHLGDDYAQYSNAVSPPVFMTSLHSYDSCEAYFAATTDERQYVYGRSSNPTVQLLEKKIAALENAKSAACFSSGMSAFVACLMSQCKSGDHIICLRDVYQPIKRFFNDYAKEYLKYEVTYVVGKTVEEFRQAQKSNTRMIILESPASLVFNVVDLEKIASFAREEGIITYIDNTYSTPLYQKPLDLGIDFVMHTISKYIAGHSDLIAGVLCSKDESAICSIVKVQREYFGSILGPMEAWLAIRGLRTLELRLKQHNETALACAEFLEKHPKVLEVNYPGLESYPDKKLVNKQMSGQCGLLSLVLKGEASKAIEFANNLKLFGKGCSWGGYESLVILPLYNSTVEELEFLDMTEKRGLIRLHCGLEGTENLIKDLSEALEIV